MKRRVCLLVLLALATLLGATACDSATPTPEPTPVAASTAAATTAPSPTASPQPTASPEPSPPPEEELLAPQGIPHETYYAPFPLSITLDGELSEWEGVPRVTIPQEAVEYPGVPGVTFAAAAAGDYLYFMGDVTDNNIISGEHGTDYWNEDSVEFYVNGTGDLSLTSYRDGVAQITVPPLNIGLSPDETIVGGVRGDTAGAQVAAVETDAGWAVEVAVPLKNDVWNIRLDHGNVIGFQVHLNGASTGSRDMKVIWSAFDKADSSYQNPSVFGKLVFFEIGQTQVVEAEPTPRPTHIPVPEDAAYKNADLPIEDRVADLLERMTLEEKVGQMTLVEKGSIVERDIAERTIGGLLSGGGGYPETNTPQGWADMVDGFQEYALQSRLGIPLIYGVDAVHGHNNVRGAVIFPHNAGLGAANDPALMERIGQVTAAEMIATGIYWNYAPCVAVPQDIRWGRTYEGYGEDPELVSALGVAYLRGLQGENLSAPDTALATPKHFVGDGGTAWGTSTTGDYEIDQGVTEVDEATLRAVHLPPYVAAIEAGAKSIMISYSSWGGMKLHAQQYLITDVLKEELGFDGFVVSDWGGIDQITDDYYESVVTAINAGIDMNMVPSQYARFIDVVMEAVENGDVPLERIDDAVRRILMVKYEMGLFDHPFSDPSLLAQVGSDEHRAVAREAVAKSLVLLKNEGEILPLAKEASRIAVAGMAADDIGTQCGGWTIEWQGAEGDITPGTTILEAIQSTVSASTTVEYERFGHFKETADVCIAVVGEEPYAEGQGDSEDLSLSVADIRMLKRLPDQCGKVVVILISGRPLIVTDYLEEWDAFVAAWLPGTEGQGVADVLFGDAPFSGKLPYTWPRSVAQLPFDFANLGTGEEGPLFPAGYGLGEGAQGTSSAADPPPLQVVFAKHSYSVAEGDSVTIGVKLTVPSDEQVTVSYATADGTAGEGDDYTAVNGTLTFEPGVQELTFSLSSLQDSMYEGDETVLLQLSEPINAPLGFNSRLSLTIEDDDPYDPAVAKDAEREAAARAYEPWGGVTLSLAKIPAGSDLELPGQGSIHTVLGVSHEATGTDSQGFSRTFERSQDWSDQEGLSFLFYGTQSGTTLTVELQDNRAPRTPSAEWPLIWSDEFDGPAGASPDPSKWGYNTGGWGWGNAEWQYYTESTENAALDGKGALVITASQINGDTEGLECWYGPCTHTSARLLTQGKFEFTYGRVEARIKLPYGQGIWPAFWALGTDFDRIGWPSCGEIDIMENVGFEPSTVHGTVHGPGYSGGNGIGGASELTGDGAFADDYHLFAAEWEPQELRWYVDGEHYFTVTPEALPAGGEWVFDHPFFLILNVAVGGYWPGYPDATTEFPQTMHVDYVRVYQAEISPTGTERFEYTFADGFAGWKEITIPFTAFVRSADQPEGAPKDGLTLTEVWGYRFIIQASDEGAFYLDQVQFK